VRADRRPVYAGSALIAAGLLFRPLVERGLAPDGRIEAPQYLVLLYGVQVLALAAGVFVLVKRPALWLPSRAETALALASLGLTLFALEAGARLWLAYLATPDQRDRYSLYTSLDAQAFAWQPHPYLSYYPAPNYTKGLTHHNSLSYRNDEFPLAKPEGVYRIVVLGGSSTYDVSIEDNRRTFAAQLEALLREAYGDGRVEVVNAGVPGYNSWEMLVNLEFRVLDLDPDLVIISEGTNDVHARLVVPSAYRGDDLGRRRAWQAPPVPLWEHSALLRIVSRMANITRQVGLDDFVSAPTYLSWPYEFRLAEADVDPAEVLAANPPLYFRRNLESMVAVAQAHGVGVLLATWPYSPNRNDYASRPVYQQGFAENNAVMAEVAAAEAVPLFDLAAAMPQDAAYWADGRHVNEAGALVKARLVADYLEAQGWVAAPPGMPVVLSRHR
jgi:lysophospholipase L1-like esterase